MCSSCTLMGAPAYTTTDRGFAAGRRWVLEELQRNLAAELDFRLEAANAQRLASTMARKPQRRRAKARTRGAQLC